jgi:poly(A) polymerase
MALSRERIADELLKLLALPDPAAAVRLMLDNEIFNPVLPEIPAEAVEDLERLIDREQAARIEPHALRRLAALLPADAELAAAVAARLRLSKKAAKRLVAAASRRPGGGTEPRALAYAIGVDEAIDRLLLCGDRPDAIASLANWTRPRLGVGGGDLVAMGLKAGPMVANTLKAVERDWSTAGFPEDVEVQRALARAHVDRVLREDR